MFIRMLRYKWEAVVFYHVVEIEIYVNSLLDHSYINGMYAFCTKNNI